MMSMELVAHRAGNEPHLINPALAVADTVELDVHLLRGRLEIRHAKVLWPLRVYWERGVWLLRDEDPHELTEILAVAPPSAHLWFDVKGFTSRIPQRVLQASGERRPLTMSCRSWWALRSVVSGGEVREVRTFRSSGNRLQLWLALRIRHPDGVGIPDRFASADTVARLRERCTRLAVWGVHDLERAHELRGWGVDVLILDDLDLIAALRPAD